jgi:hypothetical protein
VLGRGARLCGGAGGDASPCRVTANAAAQSRRKRQVRRTGPTFPTLRLGVDERFFAAIRDELAATDGVTFGLSVGALEEPAARAPAS